MQLLPTWELKQQSQRATAGGPAERTTGTGYDPAYGHLPPLYLSQMIAPWYWYSAEIDLDRAIQNIGLLSVASGTNKIEAHLYFGLLPLALILWGIIRGSFSESATGDAPISPNLSRRPAADRNVLPGPSRRMLWLWGLMGIAAVIYATGWLVPVTRHLPGFGFFVGPGRFGIVTTLAAALMAADVLNRLVIRAVRHRW
ncbi:MAG: hypothetical protein IH988_06910, partial [Planctomycetes bacterium]|nr:hypothetical protein [Planctomycetota bacterium]